MWSFLLFSEEKRSSVLSATCVTYCDILGVLNDMHGDLLLAAILGKHEICSCLLICRLSACITEMSTTCTALPLGTTACLCDGTDTTVLLTGSGDELWLVPWCSSAVRLARLAGENLWQHGHAQVRLC